MLAAGGKENEEGPKQVASNPRLILTINQSKMNTNGLITIMGRYVIISCYESVTNPNRLLMQLLISRYINSQFLEP